ncbi:hypothetical protein C8R45DRAFT_1007676 [Mycena sanguinolenta]|nr:hypothetical protein C8R45DRAFT_1007676 [Mycena sanguinolenta]
MAHRGAWLCSLAVLRFHIRHCYATSGTSRGGVVRSLQCCFPTPRLSYHGGIGRPEARQRRRSAAGTRYSSSASFDLFLHLFRERQTGGEAVAREAKHEVDDGQETEWRGVNAL